GGGAGSEHSADGRGVYGYPRRGAEDSLRRWRPRSICQWQDGRTLGPSQLRGHQAPAHQPHSVDVKTATPGQSAVNLNCAACPPQPVKLQGAPRRRRALLRSRTTIRLSEVPSTLTTPDKQQTLLPRHLCSG